MNDYYSNWLVKKNSRVYVWLCYGTRYGSEEDVSTRSGWNVDTFSPRWCSSTDSQARNTTGLCTKGKLNNTANVLYFCPPFCAFALLIGQQERDSLQVSEVTETARLSQIPIFTNWTKIMMWASHYTCSKGGIFSVVSVDLRADAPRLGVYYFLSLTLCLSVRLPVCHAAPSNWCFFFVSRWNRAIFWPSSIHVTLYKMLFFDFWFRPSNAQNIYSPKFAIAQNRL